MIIPHANRLTDPQLHEVEQIVGEFGCKIQVIVGAHRTLYAIIGDEREELMYNRLVGLPYVERISRMESIYKLMDIRSDLARHHIAIGGVTLGEKPLLIAGPCTVDPRNPNLVLETAHAVKEAGAHVLRGGVWKPRTTPHSYQGDHRALDIMQEARQQTGLPLNIEVMEDEHLDAALEAKVDMLQVGTRNALNYSLLKKIGQRTAGTRTVVLLKRGLHMGPIDEFIAAGEYIVANGNPNLVFCPRGTQPKLDGYRNHPDESITPLLKQKTWAPVITDPSHAVGRAHYVPAASLAAIAYGADGLNLETHVHPTEGIGDDPRQSITPDVLKELIRDIETVWALTNRYRADVPEPATATGA